MTFFSLGFPACRSGLVSALAPCCRAQQAHVRGAHGDAEGEKRQEGRQAGADAPRERGQAQGVTRGYFLLACAVVVTTLCLPCVDRSSVPLATTVFIVFIVFLLSNVFLAQNPNFVFPLTVC